MSEPLENAPVKTTAVKRKSKHESILGIHPTVNSFGYFAASTDLVTAKNIAHRELLIPDAKVNDAVQELRPALIQHHASAEMIARDNRKIASLKKLGYTIDDANVQRFPTHSDTQKGNLTEVFLAEYIVASSGANLPVYRLRYNPNVDQSMKGDDVLAFDFRGRKPRIIIGEAKFRGVPSKAAVEDIIKGLNSSYQGGLPASLQFVADRLYESGQNNLADQVESCALQIANGNLDLNYVGILLSNQNSANPINTHADSNISELVMISLAMSKPIEFVTACFEGIEEEAHGNP
ncbi:Hachiman antiphage defense system protein HamA [Shewanella sp. Sh95]|uniref:Hachiman antiphage defense system protein HamA n=1 Tax=Shewanella sp. Sh95 TaxID=1689868 RepID=UPI0006E21E09|nr:Hachiman antiphage defense system protein HamA [Shewanella sp. Sh95]